MAFKMRFMVARCLLSVRVGSQPIHGILRLPPDIRHAAYNDNDSASALIDDATCAVIVEPIRGEGGVVPASNAFYKVCVNCCDCLNALLILMKYKPVSGAHRGTVYAYMHYGVTPDLLTTAKRWAAVSRLVRCWQPKSAPA